MYVIVILHNDADIEPSSLLPPCASALNNRVVFLPIYLSFSMLTLASNLYLYCRLGASMVKQHFLLLSISLMLTLNLDLHYHHVRQCLTNTSNGQVCPRHSMFRMMLTINRDLHCRHVPVSVILHADVNLEP